MLGLCLLTVSAVVMPVMACDANAALESGGLRVAPSRDIVIPQQDLFVSPYLIRSDVVIRNTSTRPERISGHFSLPVIDGNDLAATCVHLPFGMEANFVGFRMSVDRQPVQPSFQERAVMRAADDPGRKTDISSLLNRHRLPLNPRHEDDREAVAALSDKARREIARVVPDALHGGEKFWRYEASFAWRHDLPAKRDSVVRYLYRPVTGWRQSLEPESYPEFCIDDETAARIGALTSEDDSYFNGFIVWLDLDSTIAVRPASQAMVTLSLEALSPQGVVSACLPGLRRTGPTTYTWTGRADALKGTISILFADKAHAWPAPGEIEASASLCARRRCVGEGR